MGLGPLGGAPTHMAAEGVIGASRLAGLDRQCTGFQVRRHVQSQNVVHAVQGAVGDHARRAADAI